MSDPLKQTPECELDRDNAIATERERLVHEGVFTYDDRIMLVRSEEDAAKAVAAERERCERILLALLHESYDMSAPACLQQALAAIRKG